MDTGETKDKEERPNDNIYKREEANNTNTKSV
jgi:hypothetical protein